MEGHRPIDHSTDNKYIQEVCRVSKKVTKVVKIQFPAGGAKPGPALAGAGIQMPKFCTAFNDQTKDRKG